MKPKLKPPGTKRLKLEYDVTAFKLWFQIQLAPLLRGVGRRRHARAPVLCQQPARGKAVQVHPIKPTLKAPGCPGTNRLKLQHDEPLSKSAFKFNLRRYTEVAVQPSTTSAPVVDITRVKNSRMALQCGLCGRGLHSSTFQLNLSRF
jgi:hypothetical protein